MNRSHSKAVVSAALRWSLCCLVLGARVSFAADDIVPVPWLEPNLAPNPDFEDVAADGRTPRDWTVLISSSGSATVAADTAESLNGQRSLKIELLKPDTQVTVSSTLIPIEGGAHYLFSIGLRGVAIYAWVQWLDEKQKVVGSFNFYCAAAPAWELRDALRPAPAQARFVRLGFPVARPREQPNGGTGPVTLGIDTVQLRKYLPPPTPAWAKAATARLVEGAADNSRLLTFFPGCESWAASGGAWSRLIADPDAERGMALQARLHEQAGHMAYTGGNSWVLPPGLYRVRARVKIPATNDQAPVGHLSIGSWTAGSRLELPFVPAAETAGKYTVVEGDFLIWDGGGIGWDLTTTGKAAWSIDSLKIFPLHELTDRELLAIYPGSAGVIPAELKPPPRAGKLNGLAVIGFGYERFRIAAAFHVLDLGTEMKVVWANNAPGGGLSFVGLPDKPADLFQYSIIYLCNINLRSLGLKYKNALREYVRRGGALVVMGGQNGYERGGWRGSLIEEALPIESAPALRGGLIHQAKGLPLQVNRQIPWLEGISTDSSPLVYYLHAVTVKPGGQVLVRAGNKPFLVTGPYGAGRVVCILGVPWGNPGPHQTPFWQWDNWVDLLRETCWWAMKEDHRFQPETR